MAKKRTSKTAAAAETRAPRLDLYAVVAIKSGKRRIVLTVLNLSTSGALLEADEDEQARLPVPSVHKISVFDRDLTQHRTVTIEATVARHDPRGVALTWKDDPAAVEKIERLIASLRPRATDDAASS